MRLLVLSDSKNSKCTMEILQFIADNREMLIESGINIKATSFSIQEYNNPYVKAAFTKQKITSLPALITQDKQIYGKKIKDYITNIYNRKNRPRSPPPQERLMPEKDDGTINEEWDIEKAKRNMAAKFNRKHHKKQEDDNQNATAEDIAGLIDDGDKPTKKRINHVADNDQDDIKLLEKIGMR